MKLKNLSIRVCMDLFEDYINGDGVDFAKYGINKKDIPELVSFYQNCIKDPYSKQIILEIVYQLTEA